MPVKRFGGPETTRRGHEAMLRVVSVPVGNAKQCFASADAEGGLRGGAGPGWAPSGAESCITYRPAFSSRFFNRV